MRKKELMFVGIADRRKRVKSLRTIAIGTTTIHTTSDRQGVGLIVNNIIYNRFIIFNAQ